jgi:hypothetical protein
MIDISATPQTRPYIVNMFMQLRTGPRFNIILPGNTCQAIDMVNFLLVDHVRKELRTCLNSAGISRER